MPAARLDAGARDALLARLRDPRWELLPLKSSLERAALLPPGAVVTVTASPGKPIEATCRVAGELAARGFRAVPHLAARMIRDRSHLQQLVALLRDGGIDGAFVIGGDAEDPGAYADAAMLLRDLVEMDHPFGEIGVGAYPQGHPLIPIDRLNAALAEKAELATYMTTQMCFDAVALTTWLRERRAAGVSLPLYVGVPGVLQAHRLLEISARIGVTDAGRFVRRHAPLVRRLLRPRGYRPDGLLMEIAPLLADPAAGARGLHLFTFNQVGATRDWLTDFMAGLAGAPARP